MNVAKFGGSSLANSEQFKKVGKIVEEDSSRKFIVVSAPGKRYEEDYKITDLLIRLGDAYIRNSKYKSYFITIMDRIAVIVQELELPEELTQEIQANIDHVLQKDLQQTDKMNEIKAIGEDSSAKILSAYLQTLGIDAHYVNPKDAGIIVDSNPEGATLLPESFDKIHTLREKKGVLVIPGFFGYTKDDLLATFSRGGSDITGAIIASGVNAELYENFTDVNAVYSVNPSIVHNPKEIKLLTYREMRELSYAGFSVFHDEALIPAFNAKIPVCIKNTNNPEAKGTMVVADKETNEKRVVGIASDSGFTSIYISKFLMNREIGFGRKLFEILEEENISFEHAPSGIDDMSIIIRDSQLPDEKELQLVQRLSEELSPDTISVHHNLALIMVVGEGMKETIGMAQTATTALGEANVNIEMINQGSSEVSMMFGIKADGIHRAIKSLYKSFFG
ncbi:MAG TPA: aspartate kinase [Pseudogracilibacillus sp.]|nr:aspartate kinase [Pseudogracilibacillus sp.]